VSQRRLERVRHVYDAWAQGDFTVGWEWLAEDAQLVPREGAPDRDDDTIEGLSEVRIEALELVDDGHRVLVRVRQSEAGADPSEYWMEWVFDDDDRVVSFGALRDD
jgi:ketosteroid isomerase-like protein